LRIIALVTDAFGGLGGIAQYNRDFLSALAGCEEVCEVIILPRVCASSPGSLPSGVRQLHPVKGRIAYSFTALQTARKLGVIDIVFCGHLFMVPLAAFVAKLVRAHLWVQIHGIEAWQELPRLHQRSIETAALATSVSRYTRQRFLRWAALDPTRVKVLPNTVNPCFRPGPKPVELLDRYNAHGKKILITVSRLARSEQYKGHDQVIRSLPRVLVEEPDAIYVIVGDGDDRPRLEALCAEFAVADKVRFAGSVALEELAEYFRLADVFVMPSTGEGFGIVFLEAIASGLYVIGGNRDGSLDALCNAEAATAIDPRNCDELVSAIIVALTNPTRIYNGDDKFNFRFFARHLQALLEVCSSKVELLDGKVIASIKWCFSATPK
jgi:phosphatidylinositol alpha-1,6-mannosyltransferase